MPAFRVLLEYDDSGRLARHDDGRARTTWVHDAAGRLVEVRVEPLAWRCAACGAEVAAGEATCPACGAA